MSKATRIAELEAELTNARNELFKAQDAGNEDAEYEWQQEVTILAKELVEARIDRPFTAYEDEYGDYPL
jgi:hypothetical protein